MFIDRYIFETSAFEVNLRLVGRSNYSLEELLVERLCWY
jgi:hypothetical protein